MSDHKFAVGQIVEFSPDWPSDRSVRGQYTIVRLYPKTGNMLQYRIKSKLDGHERMVPEDQLERRPGQNATAGNSFAQTLKGLR